MTSTSKIFKKLHTLAQILRQTHQWILRIVVALVKLQDCLQEFRITLSKLSAQSRLCIVPVFAVLCCIAAKIGLCQVCRRRKLTPSTNDATEGCILRIRWQQNITDDKVLRCTLVSLLCTRFSGSTGLRMF